MNALVFLQNPWSPVYAGEIWPRDRWLVALHRSRSGQRLRVLAQFCPSVELIYDNTTPICGETANSVVAPDHEHMRGVIDSHEPGVVIACGKQAYHACIEIGVKQPVMALPHPAWRLLQNVLLQQAGALLETFARGRVPMANSEFTITREGEVRFVYDGDLIPESAA